jgi:hypothetical protein
MMLVTYLELQNISLFSVTVCALFPYFHLIQFWMSAVHKKTHHCKWINPNNKTDFSISQISLLTKVTNCVKPCYINCSGHCFVAIKCADGNSIMPEHFIIVQQKMSSACPRKNNNYIEQLINQITRFNYIVNIPQLRRQ